MLNTQWRLGNKRRLLEKKRVLLKEGPVLTVSQHLGAQVKLYIVLFNDLLVVCDQPSSSGGTITSNSSGNMTGNGGGVGDEPQEKLKVRQWVDLSVGLSVSGDVNAFISESIRLLHVSLKLSKSNGLATSNPIQIENGFTINATSIQRVFKFYARNTQEKKRWLDVFNTIAQANKKATEIDRVCFCF